VNDSSLSAWTSKPEGPAPEVSISIDIVRRGLMVGPVLVLICGLIWGTAGVWSALYAIGLVLANFLLSAGIIAWASRISYGALMAGVLFGYIIRLGLIFVAVYVVRDASWISLPAVGTCIIVTHLGLLAWELKYVALSLAYPGLKPTGA
jgi:hypothetical protein